MVSSRDDVAKEYRERLMPATAGRQLENHVMSRVLGKTADPTKIGRYTVITQVGAGGMGEVFAAFDEALDRKIAVKVLRGQVQWHDRLRREPQALARLSHPNVVQVYDVGEHHGELFISMEFVDGPTLDEWVGQQSRTWREILDAYIQAGLGLAAAHAADIVHRDFKPKNVMVGSDERVRVLDFGLARGREMPTETSGEIASDAAASTSGALLRPITSSGAIIGTRQYMSPEQHRGEDADARADQFSYCVALYEALYTTRPFEGKTQEALASAVLGGELEPAPPNSPVPQWLRRVIVKGLAVDRSDRYPSMEALLEALGKDPAHVARKVAIAAGVALLVAATALGFQRLQERHALTEAESAAAQGRLQAAKEAEERENRELQAQMQERSDALTVDEVVRFDIDRDPTGAVARLKNLTAGFAGWESAVRMLAADADHRGVATQVVPLPPGDEPHGLSADGRIAVTRNPDSGRVQLLTIGEGTTRPLGTAVGGREAAFSPDGTRVAALGLPDGLLVWDTAQLKRTKLGTSPASHFRVHVSADGGILTFGRHPELHRWFEGRQQVFGDHQLMVASVAVHPNGTHAASVDAYGQTRLWDLDSGQAKRIYGVGPVAFSPSGLLAVATGSGDVDVIDLESEQARRYAGPGAPVKALVFSPRGGRVAAGLDDGQVSVWDLESLDRDELPRVQDGIESLRFVDDDTLGATSLTTLALYEIGGRPRTLRGHAGVGWWAVRDDGAVVSVGREGTIRVWDPRPAIARQLEGHGGRVSFVEHAGGQLITAGSDGLVRRWPTTGPGETIADHEGAEVKALSVSPSGQLIASAGADGRVLLSRAVGEGASRGVVELHEPVRAVAWNGDERLAVACPDGSVAMFDTSDLTEIHRTTPSGLDIKALWIAPDGQQLLVLGETPDEHFFLSTLARAGHELARVELEADGIAAVDFSADGRYVAFSSFDRSIQLVDRKSGAQWRLGQHKGLARGVRFSADSRLVVSTGGDGTVRLWDVESKYSRSVNLTERGLTDVAFTPDGRGFVAVGDEGIALYGRDDLPHAAAELRAWTHARTNLTITPAPIDWAARRQPKEDQ